ncbi:LCP family protein [Bacillus sp. T3]|uniref:LCP family glycopolymer transferase n=1 Tax=Bacillus sp. T3 TaxID=467262 RepID=UPI0029829540|nr:LCP family protein [Bacillus sp. T3]
MRSRMENKKKKKLNWKRIIMIASSLLITGLGIYLYNIYSDVASAVNNMNKPIERKVSEKRDDKVEFVKKDPISILLVGVDERDGDNGRTDSMLVMTLNPEKKSTILISIPRDTRAKLIDSKDEDNNRFDKMNHAYAFGGIQMTINSIEHFLNIPIDYYTEVNMEGFRDIVDAVGGINVNNQYAFELDGTYLPTGKQHLDGEEALQYSRMRKQDPKGDFGRQERQREVISKVIDKGLSLKSLTNYDDILQALEKNIKTNLTLNEMLGIQKQYKPAAEAIDRIEIEGTGKIINNGKSDIWYYIVEDETRQSLSDQLREHLGLKKENIPVD